mgnify:CR=1 FL=1
MKERNCSSPEVENSSIEIKQLKKKLEVRTNNWILCIYAKERKKKKIEYVRGSGRGIGFIKMFIHVIEMCKGLGWKKNKKKV